MDETNQISPDALEEIETLKDELYRAKMNEKELIAKFKDTFLLPRTAIRRQVTVLQKELLKLYADNGIDDEVIILGDGEFEIRAKDEKKFEIKPDDPILDDIDTSGMFKRRRKYIWVDNDNKK